MNKDDVLFYLLCSIMTINMNTYAYLCVGECRYAFGRKEEKLAPTSDQSHGLC